MIPSETSAEFHDSLDCCDGCCRRLLGNQLDRCVKCGASTLASNPFDDRCRLCFGVDLRFDRCVAIGDYRGLLQEIVVQMKRTHDEILAIRLGRLLAGQIERFEVGNNCDLVVPVPTHWLRKLKRGFHGASVIADGISQISSIRKSDDLVYCLKNTKKQGTLMNTGRFANVRGAFGVKPKARIADQNILVVDDVMTSGATASEVAKTLLRAGASNVCVAVAARGARVS